MNEYRKDKENMSMKIFSGVWIPFVGTMFGAGCVFFMRGKMKPGIEKALNGFAAGVMVAASVWSLLIPALEQSEAMGNGLSYLRQSVSGLVSCSCFCWIM